MNPEEISLAVQPEIGRHSVPGFEEIRDDMVDLDRNTTIWREKGFEDLDECIATSLSIIEKQLKYLSKRYANEDGFKELLSMYTDLKYDFDMGEDLNLDTSFREKMKEAQRTIAEVGIVSSSAEKATNPSVKKQTKMLARLGIPVDRVTLRPGADKTVILFAWAHSIPNVTKQMMDKMGITDSQEKVSTYISKLQKAGVADTVFTEGIPTDASSDKIETARSALIEKAGLQFAKLGRDIKIRGVENVPLLLKAWDERYTSLNMRTTVNNTVMAANIGESMYAGETVIATMGAGHEFSKDGGEILPYSQTIALEANANVIVVDTSKAYQKFFDEFMQKRKGQVVASN
jgi:hypothetical protein